MSLLPDAAEMRRQTERAVSLPLGFATPLWIAFGAAASAGVAWWWMTRAWRATNLEAAYASVAATYAIADPAKAADGEASLTPPRASAEKVHAKAPPAEKAPAEKSHAAPAETVDPGPAVATAEQVFSNPDAAGYPRIPEEPSVPAAARTARREAQIPAETSETPQKAGYPVVAPGPEAADAADDLTRLDGVGPKIAAALAERGVTRFAQLAAWTAQDVDAFDAALNLRGRALRSDWPAQARKLSSAD
ncbi:MAG TPA: hypothetical protein VG248_04095 [Caulobacteraceae bacterium]|jgi:predicted flap endonuclease-1-like 5' DNA nuclease|nr:hypothetical protein [Caulobacteraceae bacterium]